MDNTLFHLVLALGLTSITVFLLGTFVYFNKKDSSVGKVFFFYCFFISWWSFNEVLLSTSEHHKEALFWGRMMMAGDWFIPTLFVHFVIRLLNFKPSRWVLPTVYSTSVVLSGLSFTPYLIADAVPKLFLKYFITPGILYPFGVLFFVSCVTWALYKLATTWLYTPKSNKGQYGILFWSSLFGYVGGCANFLLVFNISLPFLIPYGTYTVPLYVAATTYAIVRYRFMDIQTVIHKTAMWGVTSSLIILPFAGLFYFGHKWIQMLSSSQEFILLAVVILLLIPYTQEVQPRIDHLFQRRKQDLQKILQDYTHEIAALKSLDDLVNKLQNTISSALYPERVSIVLFNDESDALKPLKVTGLETSFLPEQHAYFLKWLDQANQIAEMEQIKDDPAV